MNVSEIQRVLNLLNVVGNSLGPDATIRQIQALLLVAQSGVAGIDSTTVQKRSASSQASTSRALKLLGSNLGLVEFFLDQSDGRLRLARMKPAGAKLVARMLHELQGNSLKLE